MHQVLLHRYLCELTVIQLIKFSNPQGVVFSFSLQQNEKNIDTPINELNLNKDLS